MHDDPHEATRAAGVGNLFKLQRKELLATCVPWQYSYKPYALPRSVKRPHASPFWSVRMGPTRRRIVSQTWPTASSTIVLSATNEIADDTPVT